MGLSSPMRRQLPLLSLRTDRGYSPGNRPHHAVITEACMDDSSVFCPWLVVVTVRMAQFSSLSAYKSRPFSQMGSRPRSCPPQNGPAASSTGGLRSRNGLHLV
jgi:hypothetical protein